jgi:NAD-dependent deacetylase
MIPPSPDAALQKAANLLRKARHAVAFTGAGVSTPSGIPDFRSAGSGLWQKNDPMKVASLTSFRHTPQVFFDWLRPLAAQIARAQPNPAHLALAKMEKAGILKALITQNIDGLHQKAGSHAVFEVHGSMNTLSCPKCHSVMASTLFFAPFIADGTLPVCPNCASLLKPDIVLFEEMLPMETWRAAERHSESADVFLVAGSSLEVMPAAGLPYHAVEHHANLIINNYTPTYLNDQAEVVITTNVAEALPRIAQLIDEKE